jgi:hypothetical protein
MAYGTYVMVEIIISIDFYSLKFKLLNGIIDIKKIKFTNHKGRAALA